MAGNKMKFSETAKEYDLVIAGGGITGAGIFYEAVKKGCRVLLLEAEDFAWGTSSRSSKMVHGGLRYLKQGRFFLTKAAVRERERLIKQYPGLVTPLKFVMPVFDHYGPSKISMKIGLFIYSLMAGEKQDDSFTKAATIKKVPGIRTRNLVSAVGFKDAQVDDARLVLRLIHEACSLGGTALNYTKVTGIKRNSKGNLSAVTIADRQDFAIKEVKTKVMINATGAFAESLHPSPVKGSHIRQLRGSHLVFPEKIFPINRVLSFIHPKDSRPVFLFPWQNSLLLGTTDVDHNQDMAMDPFVTRKEADYLMEGINYILPDLDISLKDCISSIAGVRPVLSRKKKSASKESREHVVWKDRGLITVTGGKLTTFRMLANDALKTARPWLPERVVPDFEKKRKPWKDVHNDLSKKDLERLIGRYGRRACEKILSFDEKLFTPVENTNSLWVELLYAAQYENICHLSDLLLRRVRIGLLLPKGGSHLLDKIENLCRPCLSWDHEKWEQEKKEYMKLWDQCYSPPQQ